MDLFCDAGNKMKIIKALHVSIWYCLLSVLISIAMYCNIFADQTQGMSYEERVDCQTAIEKIYWEHRIWPAENSAYKPSFDLIMPENIIRLKVEDILKKTQALDYYWQRPIEGFQLQAEMIRIAQYTKQPEILREIWKALDNSPQVIAECLARPVLVDRHIRVWYEQDERFAEQKLSFDDWWKKVQANFSTSIEELNYKYFLPQINDSSCIDDTWVPTEGPPEKRRYHTAVWTGVEMIIWGGEDSEYFNTGARYNPAVDYWVPVSLENCPQARYSHTAIWTGTEMVVWGGYSSSGYLSTGGRYNPASDSWIATSTLNAPQARMSHTAIWTGAEMIIWGGLSVSSTYLNTGGRYNPFADFWTSTNMVNVPVGRCYHSAIWTGNEMIIWGGASSYSTFLDTGGRYNPVTDNWNNISVLNVPQARERHTAIWTGTEMIIWGGDSGFSTFFNTGGKYNPLLDSWVATSMNDVPDVRNEHSAIWTGSEMIIWGGDNIASGYLDSGGRYNPGGNSWVATSMLNVPVARELHTAVWTGTEMIIWGGNGFNTGSRYNPTSDSWIPTSQNNVPSKGSVVASVWTGIELIVWGGTGGYEIYLNTGGKYNAVTDTWTATSLVDAPAARDLHTAIWTGTEMIIWGGKGSGSTNYFKSGGRYNPASDSWIATSTVNAPNGRRNHSAVWTGGEMIVWGGFYQDSSSHYVNTGGRYNPYLDSWIATTTINAPIPRENHTAVWTGNEMIVWGGLIYLYSDGNLYLSNGGKYNPVGDTWSLSTANNTPVGRIGHTAIWTGTEMIVWGGRYYSTSYYYLNSGGKYYPEIDSWISTPLLNAPAARYGHSAVWTGTEMIVWSGSASSYLKTGGRYNSSTDSWTATSITNAPLGRLNHAAAWT
ncbi:MAG: hypothetical protein A2Y62_14410, partial [Candidatus Fischerbacteria bacterium RBG_13_37_8]